MQGMRIVRCMVAVLLASVFSHAVQAQPSAQQRMLDRQQEQEWQRQDQQLREMQVPGENPALQQPVVPSGSPSAQCFETHTVSLVSLTGEPLPFGGWLADAARAAEGLCLGIQDIQALQATLSNLLIDHGYVTSRVLIPEQDIAGGTLVFLVVVGHVEGLEAVGITPRMLLWAMPTKAGDILNLRDLEQGIENLSRIPRVDAKLDLAAGEQQGGTRVIAQTQWPQPYRATLVLDEEIYGSIAHGTAQASLDWGSPFGLADRLSLSLNTDLDKEFSDRAWGLGLNYDVSRGYWSMALNYNRQEYRNTVSGVLQTFSTAGNTDTARAELTRTLYRTSTARVSLSLLNAYSNTENRLEDAVIQVSSYNVNAQGVRASIKQLWGKTQFAGTLTAEYAQGAGPATRLPGGNSIADISHTRHQAYLTANRFISPLNGALSVRVNAQHSDDVLFPSERFSITSSASVRGYNDISLSGNSAVAGSVQFDSYKNLAGIASLRPYLAYDSGALLAHSDHQGFVRIDSATAGLKWGYQRLHINTEVSWPIDHLSTAQSDSEYVFHASLYTEL